MILGAISKAGRGKFTSFDTGRTVKTSFPVFFFSVQAFRNIVSEDPSNDIHWF